MDFFGAFAQNVLVIDDLRQDRAGDLHKRHVGRKLDDRELQLIGGCAHGLRRVIQVKTHRQHHTRQAAPSQVRDQRRLSLRRIAQPDARRQQQFAAARPFVFRFRQIDNMHPADDVIQAARARHHDPPHKGWHPQHPADGEQFF